MTQRPSGSPNAGRINCFPTKTSQPFLSQSILSQPFAAVLDERGVHTRSAVGVSSLALRMPVELVVTFATT